MDNYISEIKISNFRNYKLLNFKPNPNINFIIGENGIGKTSILESIYFSSITKSHKTESLDEMIKYNENFSQISLITHSKDKTYNISNVISKQGKKAKINNIEYKRLSDYIGFLKVVMFSPEDFMLLKGSPSNRRKFMDIEIGKFSKIYVRALIDYKKLLKSRNELLKTLDTNSDLTYLNVINKQISELGKTIIKERIIFIDYLNKVSKDQLLDYYSNKNISFKYIQTIKNLDKYYEELKTKNKADILQKNTSIGPHRDDIEFYIDDKNALGFSSQGQQRSMLIGLKFSLAQLIKEKTGIYPILLLDDVFSELDDIRKNKIIDYAFNKAQTFITATDINNIDINKFKKDNYLVYKVGV